MCRKKILSSVLHIFAALTGVLGGHGTEGAPPEPPRIALDFQGPAGNTRALGFIGREGRIFAGGENKFVQIYDIVGNSLVPTNAIRWEFGRGALGGVNAACAIDGRELIIGGNSLRDNWGDVVIARIGGEVARRVLPHDNEILSIATSADGGLAATQTKSERVLLWDLKSGDKSLELNKVSNSTTKKAFRRLAFCGREKLLFSRSLSSGQQTELVIADLSVAPPRVSALDSFRTQVSGICTSSDGRVIVISAVDGKLVVRMNGLQAIPTMMNATVLLGVESSKSFILRNAVLSPDGQYLVLMGDCSQGGQIVSFLSLVSLPELQVVDQRFVRGSQSVVTAAFDGASTMLLSHNDSDESLLLWRIKDQLGNPVPKPLNAAPLATARGKGRFFSQARFRSDASDGSNGYQLVLKESDGVTSTIRIGSQPLQELGESAFLVNEPKTFGDGWKVLADTPGATDTVQTLRIIPPGKNPAESFKIPLDIQEQGLFSGAFCFIKSKARSPFAVAIGTRKNDGIFVYRLPDLESELPELVRYFRDHNGLISDLSVSTDQKYLVSCSPDKTVKLWSLEGIDKPAAESIFGASFSLDGDGSLRVRNLQKAGILFARGIREGDALVRVRNSSRDNGVTDSLDMDALLMKHQAFRNLNLWTERTGKRINPQNADLDDRINLFPGWEPLLTLVADDFGEWVTFTPEGYFDASIAEGDRLFGWQINQGPDKPPRFEPAEHLQKEFEKPDVIRQVLKLGNVPDALAALNQPVPPDLRADLKSKIERIPQIQVLSPNDGALTETNNSLPVKAKITYATPEDAQAFTVSASQSGRTLRLRERSRRGSIVDVEFDSQPLVESNQFTITAAESNKEVSSSLLGRASVNVFSRKEPEKKVGNVYLIGFAVEQYTKEKKLEFTIDSLVSFEKELSSFENLSRPYDRQKSRILTDSEVQRATVLETLRKFVTDRKTDMNQNDLVVVCVSGHGVSADVDEKGSQFYFLPADVDPASTSDLAGKAIRWKDLCDEVNNLNCDVLWIVDACHSGQAFDDAKKAFAECRGTGGRHVIMAAQAGGVTTEAISYQVKRSDLGGTALTMAIRESLSGSEVAPEVNDAVSLLWKDGRLSIDEISQYALGRTRYVSNKGQTIVFTPKVPESSLKPIIIGTGRAAVAK